MDCLLIYGEGVVIGELNVWNFLYPPRRSMKTLFASPNEKIKTLFTPPPPPPHKHTNTLLLREETKITIVHKMVSTFVCDNHPPKIKRETMIGPKEEGGLDLPDYVLSSQLSLLIAWVKRMSICRDVCADDACLAISSFYLNRVGGICTWNGITIQTC